MSEIITDKLTGKASAGDVTITSEGGSATMQLQQGVAKFWCNYDQDGSNTLRGALNSTSFTDNGTGDATVSYTNNMSATDDICVLYNPSDNDSRSGASGEYVGNIRNNATSSVRLEALNMRDNATTVLRDFDYNYAVTYGDLA